MSERPKTRHLMNAHAYRIWGFLRKNPSAKVREIGDRLDIPYGSVVNIMSDRGWTHGRRPKAKDATEAPQELFL